jgi:hypothetical protein
MGVTSREETFLVRGNEETQNASAILLRSHDLHVKGEFCLALKIMQKEQSMTTNVTATVQGCPTSSHAAAPSPKLRKENVFLRSRSPRTILRTPVGYLAASKPVRRPPVR